MAGAEGLRLDIRLLGEFRVTLNGIDVPDEAWSRRHAAAILKILALEPGHRVHREEMMEHLWPDGDPRTTANNLHQAMHAARRALDSAHPDSGSILRLHGQVIQFDPDTRVTVDVVAFEQAAAVAARTSGDDAALRTAIDLYCGPLLPDDRYEAWAGERRDRLDQQYIELLEELSAIQEASGSFDEALTTLRALVAADPLHEPAHRALMRVLARSGQRQLAIKTYQAFHEMLANEMDIEPEPETHEVYEQVLSGVAAPVQTGTPGPQAPEPRRSNNLPASVNAFIGREREKSEVRRLLRSSRLLTLTGPGGCGKSRLSLEVAMGETDHYADGVWLVELASLSDPDFVPQAVARAVGIRELPGQPVIDTLNGWFRNRDVLLVLDNCEHLIDACATVVETLLRAGTGLRILATSREPLRIDGETTWLVPSLSLPDPDEPLTAEDLRSYESVQLFLDRAERVLPGFALTAENGQSIAQLCYRLDGIPLAIELAASRVRALTVEQIVERLSDRFQLLSGGSRTAMSRQQTLRAALDWSYNLLDEDERLLFARLSVFSGGFDLQAAEEICAAPPLKQSEVLRLLMMLVDRSLVVATSANGSARYSLLETMREYGRERLAEDGGTPATSEAHAHYYAEFCRQGASRIRGARQREWLQRLEREHENLRTALDWYESQPTDDARERVLSLAGNLYWFWHLNGHYSEARNRLSRLLDSRTSPRSRGLGKALTGAGAMFLVVGEYARAREYLADSIAIWRDLDEAQGLWEALAWSGWIELFLGSITVARERHSEALHLAKQAGDDWGIAMSTMGLGFDAAEADEHQQAFDYFESSLDMFRATNDYWGTTTSLQQLAYLTYRTGDFHLARQRAEEVLELEKAEGDRWLEIQSQSLLGEIARAEGDYATASASVEISMAMAQEIGHVATRAWTLRDAGYIALATGNPDIAEKLLQESLAMFQERGYILGTACCLAGLGGVAIVRGHLAAGVQLLGAVQTALSSIKMSLAPADRLTVERFSAIARQGLDGDGFDLAWREGQAMPVEDAVAMAGGDISRRSAPL